MIDYSWVPWFRELARKIAEGDEADLVEKAKAVDWQADSPTILRHGDANVDPFSFLYSLTSRLRKEKFMHRLDSVGDLFAMASASPESPPYIPGANPVNQLFHQGGDGRPDLLWRLFRQAARDTPDINGEDFDEALQIGNVAISKLTQTLFIVNANHFLPADHTSEVLPWPEFKQKPRDYEEYVARVDAIKVLFPGCTPYEINTFLAIQAKEGLIGRKTKRYQVSTGLDGYGGADHWQEFNSENSVWTGYGGKERKYRVSEPKTGDLILVRFGHSGRGIGVVESNGYTDGWHTGQRIAVYWINKCHGELAGTPQTLAFSAADKNSSTYQAFAGTEGYSGTLTLIEKLAGEDDASAPMPIRGLETKDDTALNRVLFGPPGTGKTFDARSNAVQIIDGHMPSDHERTRARFNELLEAGQIEFVTFHQNYAYEDFIEGIRPVLDKDELAYELRDGIFKEIAKRASEHQNDSYVLIIDEINRGNIAKIFGELITLIESSKRLGGDDAAQARLPYSQELFGVPPNLHLIGTMNTADRGILLLDAALRRRFEFVEKMPDASLVATNIEGVDGRALLTVVNGRIVENLDRDHQIGHTYLMKVKTLDELARAFQTQIVPLLQEYFYDDWQKMHDVLGGSPFITERGGTKRPVFDVLPHDDGQWRQAGSYQAIYGGNRGGADDK